MLKGSKMSEEAKAKISASLIGNQYRKGIPHSPEIRIKIGEGVHLANIEGRRRKPAPMPENLAGYNLAVQRGEIIHHAAKPERNARILADYRRTKSMEATGIKFGITLGAVSYTIRKLLKTPKGRRSKP